METDVDALGRRGRSLSSTCSFHKQMLVLFVKDIQHVHCDVTLHSFFKMLIVLFLSQTNIVKQKHE